MTLPRTLAVFIAIAALIAPVGNAGQIDSANLLINGATLEVPLSVDTGADIPAVIQTTFGKKMNEDVPESGLTAAGDLTGPGLDAPVLLTTRPGGKFTLPPHEQGAGRRFRQQYAALPEISWSARSATRERG